MTDNLKRLKDALAERYTIEREIGAGGMATVYLAHDLKHKRKVALKVLRPELAAVLGAERFVQEITTTANLQHPHILPLFDSGQAVVPPLREAERGTGGEVFLYYVMPYIEGETLRDKLDRETQLGIEEAVRITCDVADALDYAHRQGVIHRDIKPENILLHDGRPMVADFGIALAVSAASGGRMTETGLSLGTPHYMSPEQATAEKDLTSRSDIYSLGSVLYEMLTGEPPHMGNSAQQIIMKIVTDEARPVTELRKTVPPNVAAATAKSLEKLPADRFGSAAEFANALVSSDFSVPVTAHTPGGSATTVNLPAWRRLLWPALTVVLVGISLWGWLRSLPPRPVSRFMVALPEGQGLSSRIGPTLALSPDGDKLVYIGPGPNNSQLWIRSMRQLSASPIPGSDAPFTPFISPDGESVGFASNGKLQVISLTGGPPITVADSASVLGGSWGSDGFIYYVLEGGFLLARVPATGGKTEVLTPADSADVFAYGWPNALPSAKGVLFTIIGTGPADSYDIAVFDLQSGRTKILLRGTMARYAATGHIIYSRSDGALMAAPFDERKLEISGPSTPLLEGIVVGQGGGSEFTISNNGTLMYLSGTAADESLVWVDRSGVEEAVSPDLSGLFSVASISPDGGKIVMAGQESGNIDIWVLDIASGTRSRLTFDDAVDDRPVWEPNGQWITFLSWRSNPRGLWRKRSNGSGEAESLLITDRPVQEANWSADGRWLLAREGPGGSTARDLLYLEAGVDTVPRVFLKTQFDELNPALSPDGRWLLYASNESGRAEVYVRRFPDAGGRWQVSMNGGTEPRWAHSGKEIFYRSGDQQLISVDVRADGASFVVGQRRPLFSTRSYDSNGNTVTYDVTRDDERFLFIKQSGGRRDVVVVLNWFEELRERLDSR